MIRHLLKLVWNRKRTSVLIVAEIFFSFLVLFAVVALATYYADNYRQPLGFQYENVWNIKVDVKQASDDYFTQEQLDTTRQLYLALRDFEEIEVATGALTSPYTLGSWNGALDLRGKRIRYERNEVTDDFKEVMGIRLVRGRWFGRQDDGTRPILINDKFAREVFGNDDPVGKSLTPDSALSGASAQEDPRSRERIIGVFSDFRKDGEYAGLGYYVFYRKDLNDPTDRPPRNLLIRVRPGTPAAFEEKLVGRLQAIARDWSFEVKPLAEMRASSLKLYLAPLLAVGVVAVFLMIMVGLGLVGVLWQNVTQRTREIGLRRAKGATAGNIYRQILAELMLVTSIGLMLGIVVVVQFPLLDLLGFISGKVYLYSVLLSCALIYGLTTVCGLYPSWLATRVQPAAALHYE